MANEGTSHYSGPETIEALTEDREKMWGGFTTATSGVVIFVIVVLVGMAYFLL